LGILPRGKELLIHAPFPTRLPLQCSLSHRRARAPNGIENVELDARASEPLQLTENDVPSLAMRGC
jgi:hypothetical protein